MDKQLPGETMKKAVKGISYISHPLRLRILEYLDVNGASSVSAITSHYLAKPQKNARQPSGQDFPARLICLLRYMRGISGKHFRLPQKTLCLYDRLFLFFARRGKSHAAGGLYNDDGKPDETFCPL